MKILVGLVVMSWASLGCGTEPAVDRDGRAPVGGKADDAVPSAHAEAVTACDAARDAGLAYETDAVIETHDAHRACVAFANLHAAPDVDAALPNEFGRTAKAMIGDFEQIAPQLCDVLAIGVPTDSGRLASSRCLAQRTRDLATRIDGWVSFGLGATYGAVDADWSAFAACHDAYLSAVRLAAHDEDASSVLDVLTRCVEREIGDQVTHAVLPPLVAAGMSEIEATSRIDLGLAAARVMDASSCALVAAARGDEPTSSVPLLESACANLAAAQRGALVLATLSTR